MKIKKKIQLRVETFSQNYMTLDDSGQCININWHKS